MEVARMDTTAGNNNDTGDHGFPEDMAANRYNNTARELMAALARFFGSFALTSTFASNVYTISPGLSFDDQGDNDAPKTGDFYIFKAASSNTGACDLIVDSRSAKDLLDHEGNQLAAGDIAENAFYFVCYTGTAYRVIFASPSTTDITGKLDTDLGNVASSVSSSDASTFRTRISAAASNHNHNSSYIAQGDVDSIDEISQSAYDALGTKVADRLYLITS